MTGFFTPIVLIYLGIGGIGGMLGILIAQRAKRQWRRERRALAVLDRMETEWKSARIRMYLVGPTGTQHMSGTKYSNRAVKPINASTNRELLRYIGG
jgi:hypothetical protein